MLMMIFIPVMLLEFITKHISHFGATLLSHRPILLALTHLKVSRLRSGQNVSKKGQDLQDHFTARDLRYLITKIKFIIANRLIINKPNDNPCVWTVFTEDTKYTSDG